MKLYDIKSPDTLLKLLLVDSCEMLTRLLAMLQCDIACRCKKSIQSLIPNSMGILTTINYAYFNRDATLRLGWVTGTCHQFPVTLPL